eukprot:scaffold18565_cov60-Phaeocystis_antarctica.AAC.2
MVIALHLAEPAPASVLEPGNGEAFVGTRPHEENAANAVRIRDIVLAVEAIRAGVHVYLASLPAGKRLEDGGRRQRRDGHRCTGLHLRALRTPGGV